jgi:hypothetical protein
MMTKIEANRVNNNCLRNFGFSTITQRSFFFFFLSSDVTCFTSEIYGFNFCGVCLLLIGLRNFASRRLNVKITKIWPHIMQLKIDHLHLQGS